MSSIVKEIALKILAPVHLTTWASLSLFATFTGPFGTYFSLSPSMRATFWTAVIGIALVLNSAAKSIVSKIWPGLRFWQGFSISVTLFALTFLPIAFFGPALMYADEVMLPPYFTLVLLAVFVSVWAHWVVYRFELNAKAGAEGGEAAIKDARLLRRLPEVLHAPLVRLSVNDHYVDVFTEIGMHSLRISLKEATAEAEEDFDGFCVHRSHWVARSAIDGVQTLNGRTMIRLYDGALVPVSRKYRPNVVAAGLL